MRRKGIDYDQGCTQRRRYLDEAKVLARARSCGAGAGRGFRRHLGPFGLVSYVSGLVNLGLTELGLIVMMCWGSLTLMSAVQAVRRWFGKQKLRAVFWLVVLAALAAPGCRTAADRLVHSWL